MSADQRNAFPTTQWTLIGRAGGTDGNAQREALAGLLLRYMEPMRAHLLRHKRVAPDTAEDLLQGFILSRVLEADLLQRADRRKGRFRSFLLTSLDRFVANHFRAQRAKIRSADNARPLEEGMDPPDPDVNPPQDVFDVQWARTILQEAVRRVRAECADSRPDVWGIFQARILAPTLDGTQAVPYETLVAKFELTSPAQASNLLVTAKRAFVRHLRDVVAEYAVDETEIESEIADLRQILARQSV